MNELPQSSAELDATEKQTCLLQMHHIQFYYNFTMRPYPTLQIIGGLKVYYVTKTKFLIKNICDTSVLFAEDPLCAKRMVVQIQKLLQCIRVPF